MSSGQSAGALRTYERDVRERLFSGTPARSRRIGAELEFIPVDPVSGRVAPILSSDADTPRAMLPLLRSAAKRRGWSETPTVYGVPRFELPGLGVLSFEPGGQLELSTPAFDTPSDLLQAMRAGTSALESVAHEGELILLQLGLDPCNDVSAVPLQLESARYTKMTEHFARIGPSGARMMRQTASLQLSIDVPTADVADCWRLLNALAPYVVGIFANSSRYGGTDTRDASHRARLWRELDRSRTGLLAAGADPAAEYADFALDAFAFLVPDAGPISFREWALRGVATDEEWREHLSTIFPEVRPRGHLELRSADMVPLHAQPALVLLVEALVRDPSARASALEILGEPDPGLLETAGRRLDDSAWSKASEMFELALASCARRAGAWTESDLDAAGTYIECYVARARCPADGWDAGAMTA